MWFKRPVILTGSTADSASFGKQPLGMLFGQEEHVIGEPVKLG